MEKEKNLEKQKMRLWIPIAILVIAVGFLYLNFGYLTRSPFNTVVEFDEPDYAAVNEAGYKSVIDSFGSRVVVLSPENEIDAMISYSPLSANSPKSAACLAMDGSRVYILDNIMNPDGTSTSGERILSYDLNGNFKGTVINAADEDSGQDESGDTGSAFNIISISCADGRVYAACADKADENAVIIADVTDGDFKPVHRYSCTAGVPFEYTYQPQQDVTTVVTYDGKICSWGLAEDVKAGLGSEPGLQDREAAVYKPKGQVDKVLYGDNGEAFALDVNENTISGLSHPQIQKALVNTCAESFDMCGDVLVFADPNTYAVGTYDLSTGEGELINEAPYRFKIRLRGYLTWFAAIAAAVLLIAIIAGLIVSSKRNRIGKEAVKTAGIKQMTTGVLYGNTFLIMILAFAVTTIAIGGFYYNNALEKARADVIGTAYRINKTSPDSFGENLAAVSTQEDYGTPEYDAICGYMDHMCLKDSPADPRTAMSGTVYHFIDGTDSISLVVDPLDYNRIGTIYDTRDQERKQIKEGLDNVREGHYNEAIVNYDNGIRLYQIYTPVYDRNERIVGVAIVAFNESGIIEDIKLGLATRLLEIFTLLAGLCMLVAEIRFGLGVAKIQKERRSRGICNTTVIEADRPINILLKLPSNIFLIFYTLIVYGILKNNGIVNNAFLLALPVTIQGIIFAVARTSGPSIVKHDPKKYMYISTVIVIVGLALCMVASRCNSYILIVVGGSVEGIGSGLGIGAGRAIKLSGKKPAKEYSLMVFANMETSISSAIGAALGAVVRGIYGDTGLMILAIVLALVTFPVARYFVGDDIAVPVGSGSVDKGRKPSVFSVLRKNAGILFKPKIIIATFLVTLPIGFLALFSSYVLPLLNEYQGLPDVVIGAVTFGIQLATLFVIPGIVKWVMKSGSTNTYVAALFMGIMALTLLLFGVEGTMKTFIIVLLVIAVIKTLLPNMVDDIYIEEAERSGIVVNDVMAIYEAAHSTGNYAGPMILSFMMLSGVSSLGYWWGIICAVCAVLIVFISGFSLTRARGQDRGKAEAR